METTNDVIQAVRDELYFDPRVEHADTIAVSADDGAVTLRGTAGSFHEKLAATNAARRVRGVRHVDNELQVRLITETRRADADIRAAALQALALDGQVPADRIEVNVYEGVLMLTGTVPWQYQRDAARADVATLAGVVDVEDRIEIEHGASASDVADRIDRAFARNAQLNNRTIDISTDAGSVTLSGAVATWAEHDEAIAAAWSAPGVTSVHDHLEVIY